MFGQSLCLLPKLPSSFHNAAAQVRSALCYRVLSESGVISAESSALGWVAATPTEWGYGTAQGKLRQDYLDKQAFA